MSNELLPSPDILAVPRKDADRANERIATADRDRSVLTEYSDRHPDTQKLVDSIARFEAAMREPLREMPAAVSGRLADLVATIEQIEALVQPSDASATEVHFALERIQDIAMALRQREIEAALCDTLEAAIREVGDAVVRNDAAAARAQSAAALLRDLARRVSDLTALIATAPASAAEPDVQGANVKAAKREGDRFDDTSHRPMTDSVEARVVDALLSDDDHAASLLRQSPPVPSPLPANEADAGPEEDPADLFGKALDDTDQETERAGEPFSIDAMASGTVTTRATEAMPTMLTSMPEPKIDEAAPPPSDSRAAVNGPLAALQALSEEELIALFS